MQKAALILASAGLALAYNSEHSSVSRAGLVVNHCMKDTDCRQYGDAGAVCKNVAGLQGKCVCSENWDSANPYVYHVPSNTCSQKYDEGAEDFKDIYDPRITYTVKMTFKNNTIACSTLERPEIQRAATELLSNVTGYNADYKLSFVWCHPSPSFTYLATIRKSDYHKLNTLQNDVFTHIESNVPHTTFQQIKVKTDFTHFWFSVMPRDGINLAIASNHLPCYNEAAQETVVQFKKSTVVGQEDEKFCMALKCPGYAPLFTHWNGGRGCNHISANMVQGEIVALVFAVLLGGVFLVVSLTWLTRAPQEGEKVLEEEEEE